MHCLQYVFYSVFSLKKTKGMYKGASKQYQDLTNSSALSRAAQSLQTLNKNKRDVYSRMC